METRGGRSPAGKNPEALRYETPATGRLFAIFFEFEQVVSQIFSYLESTSAVTYALA